MQPDMVSDIGIAIKPDLGTDNSWTNVEITQFPAVQVRKYILLWMFPLPMPPIMICPKPNGTIEWPWSAMGNSGPVTISNNSRNISFFNHKK